MKVNLRRILLDLRREDEDLVLLALSTLRRADLTTDATSAGDLVALQSQLEALAEHPVSEVVTMAAELAQDLATNPHLAGGSGATPEAEPDREPAVLPVQRDLLKLKVEDQVAALAEVRAAPSEAARDWILELLGTPELPSGVLVHSLAVLAERGRDADVQVIRRYLAWPDGSVRAGALAAISRRADPPEVFAALLPHLKDPASDAREQAMKALQSLDDAMVQGALETMVRSESIAAKASSLYVLRHLEGDGALSLLGELAADESEEVRRRVAEAMEGRRGVSAEGLLERLLNDADIDVAERALEVLEGLFLEEGRDLGEWVNARAVPDSPGVAPAAEAAEEAWAPTAAPEAARPPAPAPPPTPVAAPPAGEPPPTPPPAREPAGPAEVPPPQPFEPALAPAEAPPLSPPEPPEPPEPELAPEPEAKPLAADEVGTDPPRPPEPEPGPALGDAPPASLPAIVVDYSAIPAAVQQVLEPLYQDLDGVLAAMGEKTYSLYSGGRLQREELKAAADGVRRAMEACESSGGKGFMGLFGGQGGSSPALEAHLNEAHRVLGEQVVDLYLDSQLRFVELDPHYRKLDAIFEKTRTVQN